MASPIEIKRGRINDGRDAMRHRASAGMQHFVQHAYQPRDAAASSAVVMNIGEEAGDVLSSLKVNAVRIALDTVAASGIVLPRIDFHCTAVEGVPCQAFMGNVAGDAVYTVFMGPKTGQHNPQVAPNGIAGGLGKFAGRGVADQQYDGTQRWFGNPRQHAHAATVVIHEIGHILHEIANPGLFWDFKLNRQAESVNLRAANQGASVSMYAMTNPLEFVAETFAGLMAGKAYPGAVMDAYRDAGGPHF